MICLPRVFTLGSTSKVRRGNKEVQYCRYLNSEADYPRHHYSPFSLSSVLATLGKRNLRKLCLRDARRFVWREGAAFQEALEQEEHAQGSGVEGYLHEDVNLPGVESVPLVNIFLFGGGCYLGSFCHLYAN